MSTSILIQQIDKQVRNRVSSIRGTDHRYVEGLVFWFGSR